MGFLKGKAFKHKHCGNAPQSFHFEKMFDFHLMFSSSKWLQRLHSEISLGKGNEVIYLETGEEPCSVDPSLPMPIGGFRGNVYKTGKGAFDNDFSNSSWMEYMPDGHMKLNNVLFAPMNRKDKIVGLLGVANKISDFTIKDAEKMFDFTSEEMIGRELAQVIPVRYRDAHKKGLIAAVKSGKLSSNKEYETIAVRKGSTEFFVELSLGNWKSREKSFFTGIIRDIAERSESGLALQKYSRALKKTNENSLTLYSEVEQKKRAQQKN